VNEQQWFHDVTENVFYRVTLFEHSTMRTMEEWLCSNGEKWYLGPGLTRETFLRDHILTPCEPVPGMLS
jgi:hypothetical protein